MNRIFQRLFKRTATPSLSESIGLEETKPPIQQIAEVVPPPDHADPSRLFRETYRFVAVDVETANGNQGSICQIGLAMVRPDGRVETFGVLIDPRQKFDDFNIALHGIDEAAVENALTFDAAIQTLRPFLERHILIQHSNFDKQAFKAACEDYGIPELRANWLDSVRIARRAWPELKGNGGHGLASLKEFLRLQFDHHDAEEDARAAALVTLKAEEKTGQTFADLAKSQRNNYQTSIALEGNQEGPLYGQVACFTGQLSISRIEAATIAAGAGITVKSSVSKKVSILVVGDQDLSTLAGHEKSSKHRRAEQLALEGHEIRIIGESEFLKLVAR
ncbi:exonuclease domain-containing protein [Celeribacter arenosi]|uniref:Exonuclease domain-containing protein n=1 Tax=Celeribacter arenosi TaxID=792649 RepID=A0ABP7KCG1_9RHOB